MGEDESEHESIRKAALQTSQEILIARQRAERELLQANESLEKQAAQLLQQREWFEVTLSSIGDAVITTDTRGCVTFMNPVAEALTGYALKDVREKSLVDVFKIVNELTNETAKNPVTEVLRSGGTVALANHTALIARDGSAIPIEDSAAPIRNAQGEVVGAVMVFHDVTRRRQAEKALRESQERLQAIFSQSPVGIGIVGLDRKIRDANPRFVEILGYTLEELQTMTFVDFTHPEDMALTMGLADGLKDGEGCGYSVEKRYIRKDGGVVWSHTVVEILRDPDGKPSQYLGIIEDITPRKQAEEARHEQAQRLRLALEAGDLSDWSWDAKTDVVTMRPRIQDLFGFTSDQVVTGASIRPYISIEDEENTRAAARKALADRGPFNLEYRIKGPSGQEAWISARGQAVYDPKGAVTGLVGVLQEITRQKQAELNLRHLAAVVEYSDDSIISKDLNGTILTWNGAAERMFGYSAAEVIGKSVTILIPDNQQDEEPQILERLRRGEAIDHYETMRRRKDGTLFDVSLSVSPIRDSSGRVVGASKIARDIGRQKRVEELLRENDRRKDEFLATLAHELRNPLAPIRQAALVFNAPSSTEAQKRWSHDVISRQVQHMALLLDDLLDISRITRGTLELRPEMTELGGVVDAAVETARPTIDAKRHRLSISLPETPVLFAADPLRLSQVLANLLTNAAKYTDMGGEIRLRAFRDGDDVVVSVSDNGIGIPKIALDTVFAMFSQIKTGHDRSEGGLGIGLALSRGLVELHHGTLEAKSDGAGKGSEFIVRLPMKAVHVPKPKTARLATTKGVKRRILVADDNRDAAESLAMLLKMEGHDVTVVHDGREALAAMSSFAPEVAILDIGMPELNGYELAKHVREGSLGRVVTLIALTGWGQDSDKAQALAAGFNHHFTKPVEPEKLLELLRSHGASN